MAASKQCGGGPLKTGHRLVSGSHPSCRRDNPSNARYSLPACSSRTDRSGLQFRSRVRLRVEARCPEPGPVGNQDLIPVVINVANATLASLFRTVVERNLAVDCISNRILRVWNVLRHARTGLQGEVYVNDGRVRFNCLFFPESFAGDNPSGHLAVFAGRNRDRGRPSFPHALLRRHARANPGPRLERIVASSKFTKMFWAASDQFYI